MAFYDRISDPSNFVISFTPSPKRDFGVFAKGFTLAANRLSAQLLDAHHFSDYEAYPIVFLYRHALEISLKHIIYSAAKLSNLKYLSKFDGRLQNSHDLKTLSNIAANSLSLLFPGDEALRPIISSIKRTCLEFSKIDPDSYSYRYPINTKGKRSTKIHQLINLRAFAEHMASLLEDLDTIHFGLNLETDIAEEIYEAFEDLS